MTNSSLFLYGLIEGTSKNYVLLRLAAKMTDFTQNTKTLLTVQ